MFEARCLREDTYAGHLLGPLHGHLVWTLTWTPATMQTMQIFEKKECAYISKPLLRGASESIFSQFLTSVVLLFFSPDLLMLLFSGYFNHWTKEVKIETARDYSVVFSGHKLKMNSWVTMGRDLIVDALYLPPFTCVWQFQFWFAVFFNIF